MKVIAAAGIQCPMENHPRAYITDAEEVEVPESVYYLRRLVDGDLLRVEPKTKPAATTKGK
jgi:hypothetical protein